MPKDTFLHLPKEKKELLINAAYHEFSRVPFHEASINQIIKEAKIPRGSFYMYFERKEDLYFFLLEEHRKNSINHFIESLKENHGDLIQTFFIRFENFLKKEEIEKDQFLHNAIMNTSFQDIRFLKPKFMEEKEEILELLYNSIDKSLFKDTRKEMIMEVFRILQMETLYSFMLYYKEKVPFKEVIQSHQSRMNLLKNGIYQK